MPWQSCTQPCRSCSPRAPPPAPAPEPRRAAPAPAAPLQSLHPGLSPLLCGLSLACLQLENSFLTAPAQRFHQACREALFHACTTRTAPPAEPEPWWETHSQLPPRLALMESAHLKLQKKERKKNLNVWSFPENLAERSLGQLCHSHFKSKFFFANFSLTQGG